MHAILMSNSSLLLYQLTITPLLAHSKAYAENVLQRYKSLWYLLASVHKSDLQASTKGETSTIDLHVAKALLSFKILQSLFASGSALI